MKHTLLTLFLCLQCVYPALAQLNDDVYVCDEESFQLLKDLSASQLSKGNIFVLTTTHQDLGWLNNIDACIADRDTLWLTPFLKRLAEEPDFRMDIEQASSLREYIHRHPETHPLISQYMKDGRICVGGTYIQPYEEMYSGESLARQFYLGARWLKKNFDGYNSLSYFNVDVPGRTLQMPQIMKKAGINNLVLSRHERGLFYWEAPDGSQVRSYSPGSYDDLYNLLAEEDTVIIREIAKESVLWSAYNTIKKSHPAMPAMLNYELSWDNEPVANCNVFMRKWNNIRYIQHEKTGKKIKVQLPQFIYATADDFFNALDKSTSDLPIIKGERPNVWLYIHGPSHEKALTVSRKGDRMLPAAEKMSAFRSMVRGTFDMYPSDMLTAAWEAKIYPDHGWGGNGGDLTDNIFLRKYEYALGIAEKVIDNQSSALASLVKTSRDKGRPIVLFNNLSFSRTAPVCSEVRFEQGYVRQLEVTDYQGKTVPSQLTDITYYPDRSIEKANLHFIAEEMPAMGLKTYYINPSESLSAISRDAVHTIENNYYRIELVDGGIRQITDKESGQYLLNTEKFLGGEVITMHSFGNGAGEFDAIQQPDMEGFDKTSNHPTSWKLMEEGPVFSAYKLRTPIRNAVIEQVLRVYHQTKKIDMDVVLLNWDGVMFREYRQMWPLAFEQSVVSYEVPYGALTVGQDEMPGAAGERYDAENKTQHPRGIGNWLSATNGEYAVTLSSSVAVADYIDPTDNPVDYTILQPILLASRKSCHSLGNDYFQPGDHFYHFSLTSHPASGTKRELFGLSANEPLVAVYNPDAYAHASLPEQYAFISIDNPNVIVSTIKKCEDDNSFIIRLYNCLDREEKVVLKLNTAPKEIIRTNLIEEEQEVVKEIILNKYAIETYKIKL